MLVYRKEDLDVIKEGIAEELKNNPEFESVFDNKISYDLHQMKEGYRRTTRQGVDVIVSEDGKNVRIRKPMEITHAAYGAETRYTEMQGSEINLRDNGDMEVITAYGRLDDARTYLQSVSPSIRVLRNASSILHTNYTYSRYKPDGIEAARGNYSKSAWGLTGMNYDEENNFAAQLYSKGYHMPKSWDAYGLPQEPMYVNEYTNITGVYRLPGHEGIAEIFTADLKPCGGNLPRRENIKKQRAYIHTEHPDRIRIDQYQIFAETDEYGNYKPTEWHSKEYTGKTCDELQAEFGSYQEWVTFARKTCDEIQADIEAKYPEWVKASLQDPYMSRPEITVAALKECFGIEEQRKMDSER